MGPPLDEELAWWTHIPHGTIRSVEMVRLHTCACEGRAVRQPVMSTSVSVTAAVEPRHATGAAVHHAVRDGGGPLRRRRRRRGRPVAGQGSGRGDCDCRCVRACPGCCACALCGRWNGLECVKGVPRSSRRRVGTAAAGVCNPEFTKQNTCTPMRPTTALLSPGCPCDGTPVLDNHAILTTLSFACP